MTENNKFSIDAYINKYIEECVKKECNDWLFNMMSKIAEEKAIENKTVTAKELCERWNISDNTLRKRENEGIIYPLETGGKKKIYSMRDILKCETSGICKSYC
jgi:ribosomal protein S25